VTVVEDAAGAYGGTHTMSEARRYLATPTGYLMVLREGDDVIACLEAMTQAEEVPSASVAGFGFVEKARFGFFNHDKGGYDPGDFHHLEITNLNGTLAWKEGQPSVHVHASGGDVLYGVVGGHVLALTVGRGSFEITVTVHSERLERRTELSVGGNVLHLP
jgi:uncharacterized protein